MGILTGFRGFAVRGNLIDLAFGVIISAVFGTIGDSLLNKMIVPVARLFSKADPTHLFFSLSARARELVLRQSKEQTRSIYLPVY